MGQDKALLPLPGGEQGSSAKTFVEQLGVLLSSFCQEVVLVTREPAQSVGQRLSAVRIVCDQVPDQGPLMGLYSGLCAIHSSHALVVAVDMPFVQKELLTFLLAQPLDESILMPIVGGSPQVMLAIYPRTILPIIEDRLRAGRRDPRSLLEVAAVSYVEEERLRWIDPQLRSFVNINTPEDLKAHL